MLDELQLTLALLLRHEPSSLKFTQWMRSETAHESFCILAPLEYIRPVDYLLLLMTMSHPYSL
jgi:hypothetical protein